MTTCVSGCHFHFGVLISGIYSEEHLFFFVEQPSEGEDQGLERHGTQGSHPFLLPLTTLICARD
jgi:hypothetical protein